MRSMLVTLVACLISAILVAQDRSSLDRPIQGEFRISKPERLHPCLFHVPVDQIARKVHLLLGFENTTDCWLSKRSLELSDNGEVVTGKTPRQLLDHLVALVPGFRWQDMDDVVVVRPSRAWDDPKNPLNLPARPFNAVDAHMNDLLHLALSAATPSLMFPHVDRSGSEGSLDRRVSIAFSGGTIIDALNAVVRADNDSEWQFGYIESRATVEVSALALSGGSVMAPVALPLTTTSR